MLWNIGKRLKLEGILLNIGISTVNSKLILPFINYIIISMKIKQINGVNTFNKSK
jgi:hypothetical protein